MNKQALKLKQKRKAERESIKNEKIDKMLDELSQYNEELGRPPLKKTKEQRLKVYNAMKEIDMKVITKTGVISLVCSFVVLYKYYNNKKKRVLFLTLFLILSYA